jgi:hypothetical protein
MENKVIRYDIYEYPTIPTENGKYYGSTPILEQAKGVVRKGKEQGKDYFIKAIYDDGDIVYINQYECI